MMVPLDPQRVMLMSLLVATDFQQLGLGKALLQHSMVVAKQEGYETMELSVAPTNTKAVGLYQKAGFSVLDEVADYLGKDEDRLIMSKQL
jgi:ribosomal protein S18 acetylase RimI-like enzyme